MSLRLQHDQDDKQRRLAQDTDPAPLHAADILTGKQHSSTTSKVWPDQHHGSLIVPHGAGIRVASPDVTSIISTEDCHPSHVRASAQFALSGQSNVPETWQGKISAFWLRNRGAGLVLLAQIFGTLMNVTTRIMEVDGNHGKGYHPIQIMFARMTITLVLSGFYGWWKKIEHFPLGAEKFRWLLLLRGFGGFFGVFGMYYSLLYLPLASATVITFLAPSITNFACSIFMHEPFTRLEQVAALVSFSGVVLIARPTNPFAHSSSASSATEIISNATAAITTENPSHPPTTPTQRLTAIGFALLGVLGAACAYTALRAIGPTTHPLISVNYVSVFCITISLLGLILVPSIPFLLPVSLVDWGWLTLSGVSGFMLHFLLAAGLQSEKGGRATGMMYSQMVFAAGADRWVFGTRMGLVTALGCALIVGSAVVVAVRKEAGGVETGERGREGGGEGDAEMGLVIGMEGQDVGSEGDVCHRDGETEDMVGRRDSLVIGTADVNSAQVPQQVIRA